MRAITAWHALRHHLNGRLTREQVRDLQLRKLRRLASHAYEKSPYYRSVMEERGIDPATCTPQEFPVLTKAEVIEHFDQIATDRRITGARVQEFLASSTNPGDLFLGEFVVIHTSGSSGQIGYYVYRPGELGCGIAYPTRASWLRLGQRMAFVGATRGHFAAVTIVTFAGRLWPLFREARTFDVNAPFAETVDALNRMRPNVLAGYPLAISLLAEAQERGELRIRPRLVQCGGEPLTPREREVIGASFQAPVVNDYVCSEALFLGIAASGSGELQLMEDEVVFEIYADHTCITNLYNYTLPLIRYRMEDILQPLPDGEAPGPFRRIAAVVGRKESAPVFVNRHGERDFIYPILLAEFFVENLQRFQMRVDCDQHFVFRASLTAGLSEAARQQTLAQIGAKLRGILDEKAMTNVTFDIEESYALGPDPRTGKFRLIVQAPATCGCQPGRPCTAALAAA